MVSVVWVEGTVVGRRGGTSWVGTWVEGEGYVWSWGRVEGEGYGRGGESRVRGMVVGARGRGSYLVKLLRLPPRRPRLRLRRRVGRRNQRLLPLKG